MYYKDKDQLDNAVMNGEINTYRKAIMAKCIDCSCYNTAEVRDCIVKTCPLFEFRNGKNPYLKKNMTEEERRSISERMKNLILARKH